MNTKRMCAANRTFAGFFSEEMRVAQSHSHYDVVSQYRSIKKKQTAVPDFFVERIQSFESLTTNDRMDEISQMWRSEGKAMISTRLAADEQALSISWPTIQRALNEQKSSHSVACTEFYVHEEPMGTKSQ